MKYTTKLGGVEREFVIERHGDALQARCGDKTFALDLRLVGDGSAFSLLVDGRSYDVVADIGREEVALQMLGQRFVVHVEDERERAAHAVAGNKVGGKQELRAAMPGIVIDVKVAVGDAVEEGKTLVVLEAMKMQNPLAAEAPGKVTRILCKKGEAVAAGALLLEME
ncbi:MAG: acetyl-CoA carboxylase biotin carboxyl carrier protein subunit [Planctomycetes bacterium]|nr:acetyl-CoA carboxylase biotin carboxyl carrier protein subunit [Planctomycetota bacterium]